MNERAHLIRRVRAEFRYATGRDYRIDLEAMDVASLREMHRLLRDFDSEKGLAARRALWPPLWHAREEE